MAFFLLKPEDASHSEPRLASEAPLYVFDTWLGDDLVRAHPRFLVTTALKTSLETLAPPAGFRMAPAHTRPSVFLERQRPQLRLPTFWELEVDGEAGVNDLGLTADRSLVISQRALDLLVRHSIRHAELAQYVSPSMDQTQEGKASNRGEREGRRRRG